MNFDFLSDPGIQKSLWMIGLTLLSFVISYFVAVTEARKVHNKNLLKKIMRASSLCYHKRERTLECLIMVNRIYDNLKDIKLLTNWIKNTFKVDEKYIHFSGQYNSTPYLGQSHKSIELCITFYIKADNEKDFSKNLKRIEDTLFIEKDFSNYKRVFI